MDEFISTLIKEVDAFLAELFSQKKELYQISNTDTLPVHIQIGGIFVVIKKYNIDYLGDRLFYNLDCNYSISSKSGWGFVIHLHGTTKDDLINTFKHFLFQLIIQEKL